MPNKHRILYQWLMAGVLSFVACSAPPPVPTATLVPSPTFTQTKTPIPPPTLTPSPTPPPEIVAALPPNTSPDLADAWEVNQCGQKLLFTPYSIALNQKGLAVLSVSPQVSQFWLWHPAPTGPETWQAIRPLPNNIDYRLEQVAFLALDPQGQWQAVIIGNFCAQPQVIGYFPVSGSDKVFYTVNLDDQSGKWLEHWILDNDRVRMFYYENDHAEEKTVPSDVLGVGDGFRFYRLDMVEGPPKEMLMEWWRNSDQREDNHTGYAISFGFNILKQTSNGYRLIGTGQNGWQYADTDNDGVFEFVRYSPKPQPMWKAYKWNGDAFVVTSLPEFKAATPRLVDNVDHNDLPPILTDFYLTTADSTYWQWQRQGGSLQSVRALPIHSAGRKCNPKYELPSPDCHYTLTTIQHYEGSSNGIRDLWLGSDLMEIPGSFVYVSGYPTYAWDPASRYLVFADADGGEALSVIYPATRTVTKLLDLHSGGVHGLGEDAYGVVSPAVLKDGSILFTIQGTETALTLYPPLGVYRLTPDRQLLYLASIPPNETPEYDDSPPYFGQLSVSPNGTMFLYRSPLRGFQGPPYRALLLGAVDGSVLYDISSFDKIAQAVNFDWADK